MTRNTKLLETSQGCPLRPSLLWMDMRSAGCAEQVASTGDAALRVNSGGQGPVSAEWMIPKVCPRACVEGRLLGLLFFRLGKDTFAVSRGIVMQTVSSAQHRRTMPADSRHAAVRLYLAHITDCQETGRGGQKYLSCHGLLYLVPFGLQAESRSQFSPRRMVCHELLRVCTIQALWLKKNEPEMFARAEYICEYQVKCPSMTFTHVHPRSS